MKCKCGNEMEKQWLCEQCGERKALDFRCKPFSLEFYEVMDIFERQKIRGLKIQRAKDHDIKGNYYDDGYTNQLFILFYSGYLLGKQE